MKNDTEIYSCPDGHYQHISVEDGLDKTIDVSIFNGYFCVKVSVTLGYDDVKELSEKLNIWLKDNGEEEE